MPGAGQAVEDALAASRRGLRVPFEEILIAALVALPFAGTLAILLGAMGLPGWLGVIAAGLTQGFGTFWIAGRRARHDERITEDTH